MTWPVRDGQNNAGHITALPDADVDRLYAAVIADGSAHEFFWHNQFIDRTRSRKIYNAARNGRVPLDLLRADEPLFCSYKPFNKELGYCQIKGAPANLSDYKSVQAHQLALRKRCFDAGINREQFINIYNNTPGGMTASHTLVCPLQSGRNVSALGLVGESLAINQTRPFCHRLLGGMAVDEEDLLATQVAQLSQGARAGIGDSQAEEDDLSQLSQQAFSQASQQSGLLVPSQPAPEASTAPGLAACQKVCCAYMHGSQQVAPAMDGYSRTCNIWQPEAADREDFKLVFSRAELGRAGSVQLAELERHMPGFTAKFRDWQRAG